MTEEQFEALRDLIHDVAWRAAGAVVHQARAGDGLEVENRVRVAFDLPPVEGETPCQEG